MVKCNTVQLSKKNEELDEYRVTLPLKDQTIEQLQQEKQLLTSTYSLSRLTPL